ncbi:hypothetical protein DFH27DRAFT_298970 [Peziza echinospora]|nr:hypothetical protein DFH27DRAFT_298970 [Peziza echinospora]
MSSTSELSSRERPSGFPSQADVLCCIFVDPRFESWGFHINACISSTPPKLTPLRVLISEMVVLILQSLCLPFLAAEYASAGITQGAQTLVRDICFILDSFPIALETARTFNETSSTLFLGEGPEESYIRMSFDTPENKALVFNECFSVMTRLSFNARAAGTGILRPRNLGFNGNIDELRAFIRYITERIEGISINNNTPRPINGNICPPNLDPDSEQDHDEENTDGPRKRRRMATSTDLNSENLFLARFSCPFNGCNLVYTQKGEFSDHIDGHTKPYTCNEGACRKRFSRVSNLNRHRERTHHISEDSPKLTALDIIPDANSRVATFVEVYDNTALIEFLRRQGFHDVGGQPVVAGPSNSG